MNLLEFLSADEWVLTEKESWCTDDGILVTEDAYVNNTTKIMVRYPTDQSEMMTSLTFDTIFIQDHSSTLITFSDMSEGPHYIKNIYVEASCENSLYLGKDSITLSSLTLNGGELGVDVRFQHTETLNLSLKNSRCDFTSITVPESARDFSQVTITDSGLRGVMLHPDASLMINNTRVYIDGPLPRFTFEQSEHDGFGASLEETRGDISAFALYKPRLSASMTVRNEYDLPDVWHFFLGDDGKKYVGWMHTLMTLDTARALVKSEQLVWPTRRSGERQPSEEVIEKIRRRNLALMDVFELSD